ncbi:MAG: pyruvate carboxylase [Alphaproteobacteria bacterium]|nr:MAG: pyruvate carboxylase [Alphaproteobacteria bacterium]PZO38586.1 MAG: pyruvate carboxylase [Alphaproteobacteria bacterium]
MTYYSNPFIASASQKSNSAFDDLTGSLGDQRPHPTEDALVQLGRALMTELVDVISDTALEDYQTILGEALIGAFHSAAGRIERDADRSRDTMRSLDRDFDGSEAADTELQEATAKARAGDTATQACEMIRDAASETWTIATGEVWTAWRGSRRGTHLTAAQLEAKQAIRAIRSRKSGEADPGGPVIAFRGAPTADTSDDAGRIFDALNWAKQEWPDMALATTGAKGAEKLAIKWAQQKGVKLILARADFDTHGKAAPFRANDELIALEPTCCLTLVHSVDRTRSGDQRPFGPALNLGQKAMESGLRHVPIKARAA